MVRLVWCLGTMVFCRVFKIMEPIEAKVLLFVWFALRSKQHNNTQTSAQINIKFAFPRLFVAWEPRIFLSALKKNTIFAAKIIIFFLCIPKNRTFAD